MRQRAIIRPSKELKIVRYKEGLDFTGDVICAIDLMEFKNEQMVVVIPGCRHIFHHICISGWVNSIGRRKTCQIVMQILMDL